MFGPKTPTLLEQIEERYKNARLDLIRAEEDADKAAVQLAERNETVLYAKERLSRLASHIAAVKRDNEAKQVEALE